MIDENNEKCLKTDCQTKTKTVTIQVVTQISFKNATTKAIQVVIQTQLLNKKCRENTELTSSSHFSYSFDGLCSEVNLRLRFFLPNESTDSQLILFKALITVIFLTIQSRLNPSKSSFNNIRCSVLTRIHKTSRSYLMVVIEQRVLCIDQNYSALSATVVSFYDGHSL